MVFPGSPQHGRYWFETGTPTCLVELLKLYKYALPFAKDSRKVYTIGVNFSSETRNIDKWIVK